MKPLLRLSFLFAVAALSLGAIEPTRPRILGISHAAFYVTDMAKARAFYEGFLGFASPYSLPRKDGGELVWIKINDRQTVELFPGAEVSPEADRLFHIALEVDDAEAMRLYLASKGVAVPKTTGIGKIGNKNYFIKDPNGNTVEIVEYLPEGWTIREAGKFLPDTRISRRLSHVGIMVGQLDASMTFYGDILGFRETWRGGAGRYLSWVNMQVPDGRDYIEFMLYSEPPDRGTLLGKHHLCLEVDDVAKVGEILASRPRPAGSKPPAAMKTGVNGRRQINTFDPDGTRVEIMEPGTFDGKPVPSSKAPPPPPLPPYRPDSAQPDVTVPAAVKLSGAVPVTRSLHPATGEQERPQQFDAAVAVGSLDPSRKQVGGGPAPWIDFNKNGKKDTYEDAAQPVERRIDDLLAQMSVEEKTCQLATLYGYGRVLKDPLPTPAWKDAIWKDGIANIDEMHNGIGKFAKSPYNETPAATVNALNTIQRWFIEQTRLGIPVDFTNEGVRGLNYVRSTNFPASIALGATWDRDLITRIGTVIAAEARAIGYTSIYAPILDLARDPRWGRVVETYGEDPYHVAELGIRMARALQDGGVTSSPKHFAVYSEPKGGRDGSARTDPHIAPREMEMLHLRPWERIVREVGIRGLMSSYNDYDGVPISGSREFLVDRLRTQWGFQGYVVSDSEAVEFLQTKHHVVATYPEAAALFIREGGNVRTHFTPPDVFINGLRAELARGRLALSTVDARVRDVLRVKFTTGLFDRPYVAEPERAASKLRSPASQALALEAAHKSIVLLKNANETLPLSPSLKRLLVCGPTAQMTETSFDRYGSNGGTVISALDGIRARLARTGTEVLVAEGCTVTDARWPESELFPETPDAKEAALIADAVAKAITADAVVVFLGDSNATIGESKSRTSLDLPGHQNDLVRALVATGRPIVAVLLTGRPATVNSLQRHVPAILSAWFPGEAGGTAIADVLFGDVNPGGKLPVTFPRSVGQLPYNFPFKPGSHAIQGRKDDPNGFGQASIEGELYPFGFGLSYTQFAYSDLTVTPTIPQDGVVTVTCRVTNTGPRAGDEVPQLYFRQVVTSVTTYELSLVGFERISLAPGEGKTVAFKLPARELALINRQGILVVEPGEFRVHVGASSRDLRLHGAFAVTGR